MTNATPDQFPLISVIMLAGRTSTNDVLHAIECFKAQTYPNKELVVINNSKTSKLDLPPENGIFFLNTPTDLTAGAARNYGIKATNSSILAQFDADYWYAPKRLESQVATLSNNEAHICVLSKTLLYSYVSGRACLNTNEKNAILGTMVFVRPANIEYPPLAKHEEFGILDRMVQAGAKPIAMPKPELCCKLMLTNGDHVQDPENYDLSKKRFQIIKRIIKSRRTKAPTQE